MIGSVLKGAGKVLAGQLGSKAVKGTVKTGEKLIANRKNVIGGIAKEMFEDNPEGMLFKTEMKKGYQKALTGTGIGLAVAGGLATATDRGKMGKIESGGMANMTGEVMSSTLENTLGNEKATERLTKKGTNINNHGAGGDIVLALHQLRKG